MSAVFLIGMNLKYILGKITVMYDVFIQGYESCHLPLCHLDFPADVSLVAGGIIIV